MGYVTRRMLAKVVKRAIEKERKTTHQSSSTTRKCENKAYSTTYSSTKYDDNRELAILFVIWIAVTLLFGGIAVCMSGNPVNTVEETVSTVSYFENLTFSDVITEYR